MATAVVNFFTEDIKFNLKNKRTVKSWIKASIEAELFKLEELNFIFCSDEYLLRVNQEYLNHDTYTDVITFDNSEGLKMILGDIFISVDRIRENAKNLSIDSIDELYRVMIHGTLHLLGYKDKGKIAKQLMTQKEDHYLAELSILFNPT